jgi:hypothetical protein
MCAHTLDNVHLCWYLWCADVIVCSELREGSLSVDPNGWHTDVWYRSIKMERRCMCSGASEVSLAGMCQTESMWGQVWALECDSIVQCGQVLRDGFCSWECELRLCVLPETLFILGFSLQS